MITNKDLENNFQALRYYQKLQQNPPQNLLSGGSSNNDALTNLANAHPVAMAVGCVVIAGIAAYSFFKK